MIVVTASADHARKQASLLKITKIFNHPFTFQIMLGLIMAEEKKTCMRVFFQRDFFRRDFFKGNIHK